MNSLEKVNWENSFNDAMKYARKIVYHFAVGQDADDLVQDFAVEVLSRPDKYKSIIGYKKTVFNILRGKFLNKQRKLSPIYVDRFFESGSNLQANSFQAFEPSMDEEQSSNIDRKILEGMAEKLIKPNGRNVLSVELQNKIRSAAISGRFTTREIAKKFKISTATINRLKTKGIIEVKRPEALRYYDLQKLGYTVSEIAAHFDVDPHSVSQQLYNLKRKLESCYEIAA